MALYENIKKKANQRSFLTVETMLDFFLSEIESSGYKIVPAEPTDDMVEHALLTTKIGWLDIAGSKLTVNREKTKIRYRAMLKNAPKIVEDKT
jgi:hypothetical protein